MAKLKRSKRSAEAKSQLVNMSQLVDQRSKEDAQKDKQLQPFLLDEALPFT